MTDYDRGLTELRCSECGGTQPLLSRFSTNQFALMCMAEAFAKRHETCTERSKARVKWARLFHDQVPATSGAKETRHTTHGGMYQRPTLRLLSSRLPVSVS